MRSLEKNELEALRLFADGKSADEIAASLATSKGVAQHFLRVAARKLGARNRVHAVALAVGFGLFKPKAAFNEGEIRCKIAPAPVVSQETDADQSAKAIC